MISVSTRTDSEVDPSERKTNPVYRDHRDHREIPQITEEELKMYKKCSNESFIKAGLPFAVVADVINKLMSKKTGEVNPMEGNPSFPKAANFKRGMVFLGNVVLGSFLYAPVCYSKFKSFHAANEKKRLGEQIQAPAAFEGSSEKALPEDFSYPTDLMTNISESESSFSADFNASKLVLEDEEKPKVPHITYDDLRYRNRALQSQDVRSPAQPNVVREKPVVPPESESSQPPIRRVRRNKYGDELE